jgi:hypothetical protein
MIIFRFSEIRLELNDTNLKIEKLLTSNPNSLSEGRSKQGNLILDKERSIGRNRIDGNSLKNVNQLDSGLSTNITFSIARF